MMLDNAVSTSLADIAFCVGKALVFARYVDVQGAADVIRYYAGWAGKGSMPLSRRHLTHSEMVDR